jgi:hypothetical protein
MFAIVYRCRREGVRLDRAAIEANPVRGELRAQRRGFNNRMAVLLKADGEHYALPVLDKVKLLKLNDRGVLLRGIEMHSPRGAIGIGPAEVRPTGDGRKPLMRWSTNLPLFLSKRRRCW